MADAADLKSAEGDLLRVRPPPALYSQVSWLFSYIIPVVQGDHMLQWLYNSDGDPVAFLSGRYVFTPRGSFAGMLYPDRTVWNGEYVGELFADDRLIYDGRKLHETRGIPGLPGLPGFIGDPPLKGPITLPLGFQDVELE